MSMTGHFSSTVGVADTSTPSVGTRIQRLSNPRRVCNYDNHQSDTILMLTVNVEMNLWGMGCSRIVLGRPEANPVQVRT
jgi:hypothetical protein